MLIELLIALIIGIIAGSITGLIPGLHINLIGVFIVSTPFLYFVEPLYIVSFVVSMSITHTFVDFIPSVFLGCPDTDTELSLLPGHKLLKKGAGHSAVMLTAYGGLFAVFLFIPIIIPSVIIIPKIYPFIEKLIPYFLIFISFLLIILEKKKFLALFAFTLSGILGFLVLNSGVKEPLLPLLTGLFGASSLLKSISNKVIIPKQKITKKLKVKKIRPILAALIASPLCSFFPGLGSGQAATIGSTLIKTNDKSFLILLGATNTLVMSFSFVSLFLISKTRTGSAVAIKELIGSFSVNTLIMIAVIVVLSGVASFFLVQFFAKYFSNKISNFKYSTISVIVLVFLVIMISVFSGFLGLGVFLISTLVGFYFISFSIKRTNMMGCLLIPTIIFYLTL